MSKQKQNWMWSPLEWAIYGEFCSVIPQLLEEWNSSFQQPWIYIDATHKEGVEKMPLLTTGEMGHYQQDAGGFHANRKRYPMAIVNGNHHAASKQIIFAHEAKREGVIKRKSQFTCVDLIVIGDELPRWMEEFVQPHTQIISWKEPQKLSAWWSFKTTPLPLSLLILTGGKSERMGQSKAWMSYHGVPQWKFLEAEGQQLFDEVFISCRQEQQVEFQSDHSTVIPDVFLDMGPLGAILSAMKQYPNRSFVVAACDMPNLNRHVWHHIIRSRDARKLATALWNEKMQWNEPLAAIWESHAYPYLLDWIAKSSCPRKFLSHVPVLSVVPENNEDILNVNTPEGFDSWIKHRDGQ